MTDRYTKNSKSHVSSCLTKIAVAIKEMKIEEDEGEEGERSKL